MIVSFGSAPLAALCNSREALARRWGPDAAATVGHRLYDLAAVTADTIEHIPDTTMTVGQAGDMTITFAETIVVRGVIERCPSTDPKTAIDEDHILITSLDVHESDRR
jgi:hypothetical protein